MHSFEVHSNESACRKKVRLGLEQVHIYNPNLLSAVWSDLVATGKEDSRKMLDAVCQSNAWHLVLAPLVISHRVSKMVK